MNRRVGWICAAVFLAAVAVRAVYLAQYAHSPLFLQPIVDAATYDTLAWKLASHEAVGRELFWQAPLYPLFLSMVYTVVGHSLVAARVVQALIGAAACALAFLLARRIFGLRAACAAALFACCCGPLILYEAELVAAGLAAFWIVALILLFLRAEEQPSRGRLITLGACAALAALTRPAFVAFALIAAGRLLWKLRSRNVAACLAAGFALAALPAASWHYFLGGSFSILPESGGINLYVGNNPDMCKTLNIRPGANWASLTLWPSLQGVNGAAAEDAFYENKVRTFAREHPASFVAGLGAKTVRYLSSRELPRNEDPYLFRRWSPLLAALMWKAGGFGFPFGLLLPLAVIGLVTRARQVPAPAWIALATLPATAILVFVSSRYRVEILPVVCVLAAAGLERLREGEFRRDKRALLAAACALLLSWLPGPFCEEAVNYESEFHQFVGAAAFRKNEPARAIDELTTAVRLNPGNADAHNALAVVLATGGRKTEAVEHCEAALKIEPDNPDALFNLGALRFEDNRIDEARLPLQRALEFRPRDSNLHHRYGIVLANLGDTTGAIEQFQSALALNPNEPDANFNLGFALLTGGHAQEAIDCLRREIELEPGDAAAHLALGDALKQAGDRAGATTAYRAALALQPDWPLPRGRLEELSKADQGKP